MQSNNKKILINALVCFGADSFDSGVECVVGASGQVQTNTQDPLACLSVADSFLVAVANNNFAQARQLFAQGVSIDYRSSNRAVIYLSLPYEERARIISVGVVLAAAVEEKGLDYFPLFMQALEKEERATMSLLVKYGANINVVDTLSRTPLQIALGKKDLSYAKQLIARKVSVDKLPGARPGAAPDTSPAPIMLAVRQVNIPLLKLLIASGAKVNTSEKRTKFTPLHIATDKADLTMMRLLLEAGADVNQSTVLHLAASKSHLGMVQLLMQHKPKLNVANGYGYTPLHLAVEKGSLPISQLLLNAGAIPNTVNRYGNTPLLEALSARRTRIAQLLLQRGANVNVANNYEKTPLDIALSKGLRHTAALMRNAGAQTSAELGAASSLRVLLVPSQKVSGQK